MGSKIGERRAIFLYSLLALGWAPDSPPSPECSLDRRLEVVIWRVPSLIGNAVTVSIVGVLVRFEITSRLGSWAMTLIW